MVRVAVVGSGRWGINFVRALGRSDRARVAMVCDPAESALGLAKKLSPGARLSRSYEEVLLAPDVDAVVLATPAVLHAEMAERALMAGKHVLVEKPFALRTRDAERVIARAKEAGKVLMVGHLMVFHPVVEHMREVVNSGELGRILYLYALRVNLGVVRRDENAMWSLGPHDVSMILYLVDDAPVSVTARGGTYLQPNVPDVVFLNIRFSTGVVAQVQNSWLDPRKERRLTVVGSKKMMEMDDLRREGKLQIFDKGIGPEAQFTEYGQFLSLRSGAVISPEIRMEEPLIREISHFLDCVTTGRAPRSSGEQAIKVVRILEAAQRSLEEDGAPMQVGG